MTTMTQRPPSMNGTASTSLPLSPTLLDGYLTCPTRLWLERRPADTALPVDETATRLGRALHGVLMALQVRAIQAQTSGRLVTAGDLIGLLPGLVHRYLYVHRLERRAVEGQVGKAWPGLELAAQRMCLFQSRWVLRTAAPQQVPLAEAGLRCVQPPLDDAFWAAGLADPSSVSAAGRPAVWAEPRLDHGPGVPAVQIMGRLFPTRPDVIGIRRCEADPNGPARVVIIDYKLRRDVVRPTTDLGLFVRAAWALNEIHRPHCRWFLAGWDIEVDHTAVDLEVVNLLHTGTDNAVLTHTLTLDEAHEARARLLALADEVTDVLSRRNVEDVPARPGPLCEYWCPVLHRCADGQRWVAGHQGPRALRGRLAQQQHARAGGRR